MQDLIKFETGKTYFSRFICDADSKCEVKIERRTEKSVWIKDIFTGEIQRRVINTYHGNVEKFKMTDGLYFGADREAN